MAIHESYDKINTITGLDIPWEGKTGVEVEDFISRRLANPIGSHMSYEKNILTIFSPEGVPISTGNITPVEPTYINDITFSELKVDSTVYTDGVEINFNEDQKFYAGINIKTYYVQADDKYNLPNKVNVVFSIEGDVQQYIVENISPKAYDDDTLEYLDITPLLRRKLNKASIRATVTTAKAEAFSVFKNVTIHKIELSTTSTYVDNRTITFDINGLDTIGNMQLEYYDVELGQSPEDKTPFLVDLTSNTYTELKLEKIGSHQILARITNPEKTFYSNWVQANIIAFDSSNKQEMMVMISGIPERVTNCENTNLYKIICVPGTGGTAEIISYLTNQAGHFSQSDWSAYEFNRTSISTTSNDKESTYDYYTYIELPEVNDDNKFVAFKLKVNDVEYPIYQLYVNKGALKYRPYFSISIEENPYNIKNAFNYTEGAKDNFSQITGQSTSLFTNINPDIEASDGWTVDNDLICYKISGQDKNLFTEGKDMLDLLNSDKGFSIEVMLKNYNVNGEDPVMSIGNLLFGPGFTRINHSDKSDEGIYVNSRADYEKDVITHLMFVFDPAYKPTTYLDTYDKLFNDGTTTYSAVQHTYPILKVYVNGCINREIEITREDLKNAEEFKLQICPKSSDLNLYIFRTYRKALNYLEIQKNFISSRQTTKEKKDIYDRNNILGDDGKISFYKSMLNHNVLVFVLPKNDKPLFFGNRQTTGDGLGSDGTGKSKATILVRYKDEKYKHASGRFTGGKYKAQGSSAKKYMIHNTQYSKGNFLSEEQIAAGVTEGSTSYVIPTDPENIAAKKLVGKVNYASSMQSHKQGATKLYDRAYKEIFGEPYNGGKKACLEEAFMYFYYNVDDDSKLDTITIEDLYTTSTVNGITIAQDSDVKFLGFQTWGSAKADDPTYGYDEDVTPEYLLVEGADNASPGANFKQPWAAFQIWDSTKTRKEHETGTGVIKQQLESVTNKIINGSPNPNYDPTKGLLIEGETIRFESDTDPWDIDYGLELYIKDGESKEVAEDRDLWVFNDKVKNTSLRYFVDFYNNCYQYDFTNLIANPNSDSSKFNLTDDYKSTDKRIYMTQDADLYQGDERTGNTAKFADVYRWDIINKRWVPAGLHHNGSDWQTFNLAKIYKDLKNDPLYIKYESTFKEDFDEDIYAPQDILEYVIPAFKDMFMATIEEYCDKNDIAYHQAFIRLVSGTDNRAKNTYFQIIGKKYQENEETGEFVQTEEGDYKIRLMQDDLDTIFATDNNGQQVKPYYLLEPPFNKDTEGMWGDAHSAFFYPFDVCYYDLINEYLGKLINHLIKGAVSVKSIDTKLDEYFFSTQRTFPEIAYNHHAEIYYEMPQVLFSNGNLLQENGQYVFKSIIGDFTNNNVKNPLSLSHGRCLESEYQFMKDRLLMLGTSTLEASGLYSSDYINLSDYSTGGDTGATTTLKGEVSYTDYFYPIRSTTTDGKLFKIGNITNRNQTSINYDSIFSNILDNPGIPNVISQLVTPDVEAFTLNSTVSVGMGTRLNAGSKYKTLHITYGLDYSTKLLKLPNAKSLIIDGKTANYNVTDTNIVVKDYLPIVENLVISNATFGNSVLDFRGCNRLETINLSGCTGIVDIIFPENNRLTTVYLPKDLKKLTLGKNPNLSTFIFDADTKLTEISLDCSSFNDSFDYMDILENKIDYTNLKQFILRNTPSEGLNITESVALQLATITNKEVIVHISGTFNILDRNKDIDSGGNITYTWGSKTDIKYSTKKSLVNSFGNIDSSTNKVVFKYTSSVLQRDSYKLPVDISIDAPNGGTFKPFDSLNFSSGNNVKVTNGILDITYSIANLPSGFSLNANTGELYIPNNTDGKFTYSIIVNTTSGSLDPITGNIYFKYLEPEIGNYAYSDGTFSSALNEEKTLIGLVFQKEVVIEGQEWKLGILSNKSIYDYAGPDSYHWLVSDGTFNINKDEGVEQSAIYGFMTNSQGLNLSITSPNNVEEFQGVSDNVIVYWNSVKDLVIDYNTYSSYPTELVPSGAETTMTLAQIGLDRLKPIATMAGELKSYMINKGFLDSQNKFTNSWNYTDFEEIEEIFNTTVQDKGFADNVDYYKVLNPLALRISLFEPESLKEEGLDYYSKGKWYIPSKEELTLLVWHRIRSTTTATTSNTSQYWDSSNYIGSGIFASTYTKFNDFLSGDLISAELAGTKGQNLVYGKVDYYNASASSYVPRYGWFTKYETSSNISDYNNHESCRRDKKYSIAPCCSITVTKN